METTKNTASENTASENTASVFSEYAEALHELSAVRQSDVELVKETLEKSAVRPYIVGGFNLTILTHEDNVTRYDASNWRFAMEKRVKEELAAAVSGGYSVKMILRHGFTEEVYEFKTWKQ